MSTTTYVLATTTLLMENGDDPFIVFFTLIAIMFSIYIFLYSFHLSDNYFYHDR